MQIFVSKAFSSKLKDRTDEQISDLNKKINIFKSLNKTEILEREDVIELTNNKDITIYAYNIQASVYILFAFKEKNELVLLDEIKLISKNEIESLVYGSMSNNNNDDETNDTN